MSGAAAAPSSSRRAASETRPGNRVDRSAAWGITLLLIGIYALSSGGHAYSSDEEVTFATTRALVERGTPELELSDDNDLVVHPVRRGRTGGPVGVYGLGQSVAALPFYLAGAGFGALFADGMYVDYTQRVFVGWLNSFVTAAGVALFFLIARRLGALRGPAAILAMVYALATLAWPHSKTFFSEPLATTLVLAAAYWAIRGSEGESLRHLALSGAFAGLAVFARITSVVYLPVIPLYLAWKWSRGRGGLRKGALAAGWFTAGGGTMLGLYLVSNWWRFGSPFDPGYQDIPPLNFPVLEGLAGLFLSPGKSVFLYAPVTALGIAASLVLKARRAEVAMFMGIGIANALFFARFTTWHGDYTWGPRYLVMSLPFFVLPLAVVLERRPWRVALATAATLGVISALLGTIIYFNQYFDIVDRAIGDRSYPPGEDFATVMRHNPYWSPLAGHLRALPDALENTVDGLDGDVSKLEEFPDTTDDRYHWFAKAPQLDSWIYWLFPARGPKALLIFAPLYVAIAVAGALKLRGALLSQDSAFFKRKKAWTALSESDAEGI